ncbi:MAG: hypothetical protein AAF961_05700, partial [Planctomycetota bacterium]
ELLDLKQKWGFTDPRLDEDFENCDICANDVFRKSWSDAGVATGAFGAPEWSQSQAETAACQASTSSTAGDHGTHAANVDEETLVQAITDRVLASLRSAATVTDGTLRL